MAFHRVREDNLQTPPRFLAGPNRRNFFGDEIWADEQERHVEIGPQCFAAEAGDVDIVLGRFPLLFLERLFWVIASFDWSAVRFLDDDSAGVEDRAFILAGKVRGETFRLRFGGHYHILQSIRLAFHIPNSPGDGRNNFYGFNFVPTIETPVRLHSQTQFIQGDSWNTDGRAGQREPAKSDAAR